MSDLIGAFKQRAEDLISVVNRKGGVKATIESLRRQMAESDRRRAISKVREDLRRLDQQINELITAVGVQAVGLHEAVRLNAPELQPLCQHVIELKAVVTAQRAELAKLEAVETASRMAASEPACAKCGQALPERATFCPYCGQPAAPPPAEVKRFCPSCGADLRPGAKFCAKCGQATG